MKRYAIILSCQEYEEDDIYPTIEFCHEDAYLLKETLVKYCDFAEQDIYNEVLDIYHDKEPKDILNKIEETVGNSKEGDTILFYYAGHGDFINGDSYLVLPKTKQENIEQTAISIRDINKVLRKENRINVRVFDCCHSGFDARGVNDLVKNQSDFTKNINDDNEGWFTFASCTAKQLSYPDNDLEHGVFTYYLSEAIKEYEEGTEIMPEILKIRICDKVAQWCKEKRKVQTPTFNASINGNISFAIRKKEEVLRNKDKSGDSSEELKKQIDLIRNSETNNTEGNIIKLKEYVDDIKLSLNKNKDIVNTFDLEINENPYCSINDVWDDYIKDSIVKFLNNKKYNSLHKYSIDKKYEKVNENKFFIKLFPEEPKLISINYKLEQSWGFPESYTNIELIGDKCLPTGIVFAYVCPLVFTTCIIFGIGIQEKVVELKSINLKVGEKIGNIDKIVCSLLNRFNELYKKSVIKNIRDYNQEIKAIKKDIEF